MTFGLLLAGGQARRMGGGDKALLPLGDRPMIGHVIERLARQCSGLAISANGDAQRFAEFALPVLADETPGAAGPLAGLLAGLEYVRARGDVLQIVTLPADTPFAPLDLVTRLYRARVEAGAQIAVARSGGREHHLAALWPASIVDDLRRALFVEELRTVGEFASRYRRVYEDWATEPYDPFFNINAPGDLQQAEALLRLG